MLPREDERFWRESSRTAQESHFFLGQTLVNSLRDLEL